MYTALIVIAPVPRRVPATRAGVAWASVWTAAMLIASTGFIPQNTPNVEISVSGMHPSLPLTVALLFALVAGIVVTLMLGRALEVEGARRSPRIPAFDDQRERWLAACNRKSC